jgi:hypothetical protein
MPSQIKHFMPPIKSYCRERELPVLIGAICSKNLSQQNIVESLQAALNTQRRYARSASWRYNLTRHIRLIAALKAEKAAD